MTLVDSYFLGAYAGHGWEFESLWIRFILSCIHDTPSRREQDSGGEGLCWQCTYLSRRYRAPERGTEAESDWGEERTLGAVCVCDSRLLSTHETCQRSFSMSFSSPALERFLKCYDCPGLRLPFLTVVDAASRVNMDMSGTQPMATPVSLGVLPWR
jgi:hypothetical protein